MKTKKPVCLAVNKVDNLDQASLIHQFHSLGISKIIPVSAAQGWQIAEMLEAAFEDISTNEQEEPPAQTSIKVAIVGRPNVGKSSLVNHLLDEERCIVSPIPGTTRDSVDISFSYDEHDYTLIDTAGIRRKGGEHEVVDKFAAIRTERAIDRADLCLLMLDVQEGITTQDKRIANKIEEAGKGCIILFNKWDLIKGVRMEHCLKTIEEEVPFLKHCPKIFISALMGRNIDKIFPIIQEVYANAMTRITTHKLNKFIELALQKNHPPMIMGKRLRIYYMAQVGVHPPKFILFVNSPNLMLESYKKYLYNQFRETYGFAGVPIKIYLKGKEKREKPALRKEIVAKQAKKQAFEEEGEGESDGEDFTEHFSGSDERDDYDE